MRNLMKATMGREKNPRSLAFAVTLQKFSRSQLPVAVTDLIDLHFKKIIIESVSVHTKYFSLN